ncbi:F0F1 ATP synthase subunit A [Clostridium sp. DL1XJH146]
MEGSIPVFFIKIFGLDIGITEGIIVQWAFILILLLFSFYSTRNLTEIPSKLQHYLEIFVEFVNGFVEDNMGKDKVSFAPFVGSLILFLLLMNVVGLVGFEPPTKDLSVTIGMALITFIVIQGYTIKKNGILGYFGGFLKPLPILLPTNIMERVMLPVSLSVRLFGNILAATFIVELIYSVLGEIGPIAQLIIPIPFQLYFDVFDGTIQMVIFVMLTMINIKIVSEH